MIKASKVMTIINYCLSAIYWLMGILILIFNLFGAWDWWLFTGYMSILYGNIIVIPVLGSTI